MEIFLANFLETKRLSLMNSGDLLNMCHCKDYMHKAGDHQKKNFTTKSWETLELSCSGYSVTFYRDPHYSLEIIAWFQGNLPRKSPLEFISSNKIFSCS